MLTNINVVILDRDSFDFDKAQNLNFEENSIDLLLIPKEQEILWESDLMDLKKRIIPALKNPKQILFIVK